ncbi:MAG: hypothetical protein L0210_11075 [Rhodospirillales bacterium]|nr:hypothetical protein [Rhodospirillales bacterium]
MDHSKVAADGLPAGGGCGRPSDRHGRGPAVAPGRRGKTTLARLLVGVLRPQLGQVRLDGVQVTRLAPRDRAKAIGYVPAQPA